MSAKHGAAEYLAAGLVEFARARGGEYSADIEEAMEQVQAHFSWNFDADTFVKSVDILSEFGIGSATHDDYAGTFVAIDYQEFRGFVMGYRTEIEKYNAWTDGEEIIFDFESDKRKNYPRVVLAERYPVIEALGKFGSPWITKAISKISEAGTTASSQPTRTIDASAWTGRYVVSDADRLIIAEHILQIKRDIDRSELTNAQKAEAISLVQAAEALMESPNPAWDWIAMILSSPILANITSMAALAVALIKG